MGHKSRGDALTLLKRLDEAIVAYESAIAADSEFTMAFYNLGVAYFQQQKFVAARDQFARAVETAPEFDDARKMLAHAHLGIAQQWLATRDQNEARKSINAALTAGGHIAEIQTAVGVIYAKLGSRAQAKKHFQEAVRLEPNSKQAREYLKRLERS